MSELRDVEEIRRLQCLSAQITAMRSALRADSHLQEKKQREHDVEDADAGWRHAVSAGRPGDHAVRAWCAAVVHRVAQLREADERLASSRYDSERARRDWEHAVSLQELANAFVTKAQRRVAADLDERRGAELTDQHLARRILP